jgi:hypothetical protein
MGIATLIFHRAVINYFMPSKRPTDMQVSARCIRHESGVEVGVSRQKNAQLRAYHIRNVIRAHTSAALYERMDDLLSHTADVAHVALAGVFVGFFPGNVGRVGFDYLASVSKRSNVAVLHSLANAMREVPGRLHAALKHSLNLAGANALLAGAH